jgi:hypothetical protein
MPITGTEFEGLVKPFFRKLFTELGFTVLQVRNQRSGTQNGFDIMVSFFDSEGVERSIFIECKYYESRLSYTEIAAKIIQLAGSNYTPDGFIALSPKKDLSNIDHSLQASFETTYKFPSVFWTPDCNVQDMFALDPSLYERVYDEKCSNCIDRDEVLSLLKSRIDNLLAQRDILAVSHIIEINESTVDPVESDGLRTSLDQKLDAVFSPSDPNRISYHQHRCNYKVFIEGLQDVDNTLRSKILKWQDDLRAKATRLTHKFQSDPTYTPTKFFHEFFDQADVSLGAFYQGNQLTGSNEKLLQGVVLELAAECPLDWRPNSSA